MKNYFWHALTKQCFDYNGRATCSEFWLFLLLWWLHIFLAIIATALLENIVGNTVSIILTLFIVLFLGFGGQLAFLSLTVRRLRDAGFSGWWILLSLTGFGVFVLFVLCSLPTVQVAQESNDPEIRVRS